MLIFKDRAKLSAHLNDLKKAKKKLGFVPTMGALHQGHISLIEASTRDNHQTICSIFINPTQFNNTSDLENYPQTLTEDLSLLEENNCDIVYLPTVNDIYPNGVISENFNFLGIENAMEGKQRPGHFDGVGTVVSSFFDIIQPNKAYFGEKDFQQLAIINRLAEIKNYDIEIVGCPILREQDGLAMSSRNLRLTKEQRSAAPSIFKALKESTKLISNSTPQEVAQKVSNLINQSSILEVEYVEIADEATLTTAHKWSDYKHIRLFTAVNAGDVRLIDNMPLF